ncbi:hypothetical protein LINPERHAP1_LOCUS6166 [Linum perenne]
MWWRVCPRRKQTEELMTESGASRSQGCFLLSLPTTSFLKLILILSRLFGRWCGSGRTGRSKLLGRRDRKAGLL